MRVFAEAYGITLDEDLVELDFGNLEGLTGAEAQDMHPLAVRRFMSDLTVAAPGGESIADVSSRVARPTPSTSTPVASGSSVPE